MPQLAQLVRAKYPGVYDDLDDAALEAAVRAKYPGVYDDLVEEPKAEHPHARVARLAGENLPAIGGAIGSALGMVGGPVVSAGTAALGGAAGRLGQRVLHAMLGWPAEDGLVGMAADAGQHGAVQGALDLAGGAATRMLAGGARRLYTGLAKPSKTLRADHPDAVQTALAVRAPISQGGLRKLEAMRGQSAQQADAMIDAASPTARPIRAREVISEFGDTVKELRRRADIGQPSELAKVGERGRRLIAAEPAGGMELSRAQELKRTAQNAASAGYLQAKRGTVKEVTADTMLDKDVARGLRAAIERRVPDVAGVNQRTQSLGGAASLLEDAVGREGNTHAFGGMRDLIAAGSGGGVGAAFGMPAEGAAIGLLMRLLSSPATGSLAAIGMNEASRLPHGQLLRLLMSSHGSTGTPTASKR